MAKKDIIDVDKIDNVFKQSSKEFAEELLFTIQSIYETAIDRFYNDYNPLYYNRTFSTYEASSGANDLFSSRNYRFSEQMNSFLVGIEVSPLFINRKPYRADTGWVFDRTFNQGIHGIRAGKAFGKSFEKKFLRVYSKPNFTFIKMQGNRRAMKKQYYHGLTVSRRGKYFYTIKGPGLGAPQYREAVMSNMSPTPKGIVGSEFRKLTRKKELKQMFNNILAKNIG